MEDIFPQVDRRDRGPEERVRIGKLVTIRDKDNVGAKYLIATPASVDALKRHPGIGAVLSSCSDLGRAIYNRRAGEEKSYKRDRDGETVSVWIVLIEEGPQIWYGPPPEAMAPFAVAA